MAEFVIAVALILLNGAFSLSELAIVSARKARLTVLAKQGRPGARAALALAEDPGRFLSTVQIGITLIGVVAGAFSGAGLGRRLAGLLQTMGVRPEWAEPLGFGVVIVLITYLSVVVGELVPKNLALNDAEGIACTMARPMRLVSRLAGPVVSLLDASTKLIFRLFGRSTGISNAVTDEEIRAVMAEAEAAGVIETDERRMISAVLRLGDRTAKAVMTPRTEVEWIDLDADEAETRARLLATSRSRLPAGSGRIDDILGVVQIRDLVPDLLRGRPLDLRAHLRRAPVVPDTVDALESLQRLRSAEVPMALVHDEYGHFEGLITPADILDAIAGAFRADERSSDPEVVQRQDGSWLIAGWLPVDEMAEHLGLSLPDRRGYETAAGLVIAELRHLPQTGETVEALGWRFEVVDMDGRRIDKILATRLAG